MGQDDEGKMGPTIDLESEQAAKYYLAKIAERIRIGEDHTIIYTSLTDDVIELEREYIKTTGSEDRSYLTTALDEAEGVEHERD